MTAVPSSRTPWTPLEISLLIGSVLLITLAAFEGLATTTIMPNVVQDLDAESWFSLASGATLAAQIASTVVAGGLADSKGPRAVLVAGLVFFTTGLLVSAFSPTIALFTLGRLIQGIGGGLVIVPLYVFIGAIADPSHRPFFFAAFSLAWVFPGLVGPAIAGWVAASIGWRPVFWAVPILAAFAVIPLISVLRKLRTHHLTPAPLKRLLFLALLAGTGVLLLQLSGALGGTELILLSLSGLFLSALSLPKLLPKGALRLHRGVPSAIMTRLAAMGAQAGGAAFLPLILQRVHHWEADSAALAVTIGSISWATGATLQSRFRDPGIRMRLPLIGTILLAVGLTPTLLLVAPTMPVWPSMLGWFLCGAGTGLMHSTLSVLALELTPSREHGKVSSWLQVADSAGSAVELAIASIALSVWGFFGVTGAVSYLPAPVIALLISVFAIVSATRIAPAQAEQH